MPSDHKPSGETSLPLGKLPYDLLERMLDRHCHINDPRVIVGPRFGEDAAVIDCSDRYLIAKTDPVTFAADNIGWYAVNVNANDIATRGATPKWFMASVLLPEGKTDEALVDCIFARLRQACDDIGTALIGGHTEITYGLDRPIVVGSMLGEVEKDRLVSTSGALPGDAIIITKGIVIEGTALIAREKYDRLLEKGYNREFLERCCDFLYRPGISVVRDALAANESGGVHAMHDPTEGGLAAGLFEIAEASHTGLRIERERIPVFTESETLCHEFGLDPLGTLTSGTLLIAAPQEKTDDIVERLTLSGIDAVVIGFVSDYEDGLVITENGREKQLLYSNRDEITRIFQ